MGLYDAPGLVAGVTEWEGPSQYCSGCHQGPLPVLTASRLFLSFVYAVALP